ncbi:MAG: hypothetical protein ACUVR3_09850, partial [Candidatus Roseilinea sp.]
MNHERTKAALRKGIVGKLLIVVTGMIVVCCLCSLSAAIFTPGLVATPTATPAMAMQVTVLVAATATVSYAAVPPRAAEMQVT